MAGRSALSQSENSGRSCAASALLGETAHCRRTTDPHRSPGRDARPTGRDSADGVRHRGTDRETQTEDTETEGHAPSRVASPSPSALRIPVAPRAASQWPPSSSTATEGRDKDFQVCVSKQVGKRIRRVRTLFAACPTLAALPTDMTPTFGPPPKTWLKFCSRFLSSILKYFISSSTRTTCQESERASEKERATETETEKQHESVSCSELSATTVVATTSVPLPPPVVASPPAQPSCPDPPGGSLCFHTSPQAHHTCDDECVTLMKRL